MCIFILGVFWFCEVFLLLFIILLLLYLFILDIEFILFVGDGVSDFFLLVLELIILVGGIVVVFLIRGLLCFLIILGFFILFFLKFDFSNWVFLVIDGGFFGKGGVGFLLFFWVLLVFDDIVVFI